MAFKIFLYLDRKQRCKIDRGVGTGETGEARASPEIRGCLKSNSQIGKKKNTSGILLFLGASPEITLFLRPCLYSSQPLFCSTKKVFISKKSVMMKFANENIMSVF